MKINESDWSFLGQLVTNGPIISQSLSTGRARSHGLDTVLKGHTYERVILCKRVSCMYPCSTVAAQIRRDLPQM